MHNYFSQSSGILISIYILYMDTEHFVKTVTKCAVLHQSSKHQSFGDRQMWHIKKINCDDPRKT